MDAEIQARRVLEVDLHRALSAGEFHIDYQPLINLATNEVVGMEALVRWTHRSVGRFLPLNSFRLPKNLVSSFRLANGSYAGHARRREIGPARSDWR